MASNGPPPPYQPRALTRVSLHIYFDPCDGWSHVHLTTNTVNGQRRCDKCARSEEVKAAC
ncbi:MAG TPA: hypothetical protein ENK23_01500 [Sorangium sp.]|nr:hypothetical protein [Sorangium sp.]